MCSPSRLVNATEEQRRPTKKVGESHASTTGHRMALEQGVKNSEPVPGDLIHGRMIATDAIDPIIQIIKYSMEIPFDPNAGANVLSFEDSQYGGFFISEQYLISTLT